MKSIIFACCIMLLASCSNNEAPKDSAVAVAPTTVDSLKEKVRALALRDYDQGQCKYYFNTMSIAPKEFVAKAKVYDVAVVTKSCVLDKEELMYNQFIDSIYFQNKQIKISDLL